MLAPFGIRPKGTLLARMLPLAQALVRRGHQVSIAAPAVQNPEDAGTCAVYGGVPVHHVALAPPLLGPLHQGWALLRAARAARPDLVHVFKPKGYSGLAALGVQRWPRRLPLVLDTDDWEGWGGWNDLLPYPYPAKLLFGWQERDLARRADAVTTASRTLQSQVWGFGVPPGRTVLLPNGADARSTTTTHRYRTPGRHLLLYTRFWELDLRELVRSLVATHALAPELRLTVVGKGERGEERELLRLGERAGLADMINYHGWASPDQIPELLAAADIALAPLEDTLINRARGLAKLLELMQAGLPIVAHQVGMSAEYLGYGQAGRLVAPGDVAGFARAIVELAGDASLREQLGLAAQRRAASAYSWDVLAAEAERAYAIALGI
ncbi:glycosyltransferase family 4 protein [Chloroflexia bacterium SDU3-3]|nr:glycosyltransferase family 4 protein [Chloroflexia bacterium SDU3-3]